MTTQKAVDIINVLQDKYGSPAVDPTEIVDMLNMATFEWLNRLFPSNLGGVVNFEADANTLSNVKPLIYKITANMSGGGVLTNSAITTALQLAGAETGATWFRIGNLGITISSKKYPLHFKTHNEFLAHERNFFKRGKAKSIGYTINQGGLEFNFTDSSNPLTANIIKNPRLLNLSTPVNPELDDQNMYNIIAIALKLVGVSTRDSDMIMDIRNTAVQTAQ